MDDDETGLRTRLRAIIQGAADRHALSVEWEQSGHVTLSCSVPQQPGLDFTLCFWLADDEFGCAGEGWYAAIFSAFDEETWMIVTRVVDELFSGSARILLYRPIGRARPYWTALQLREPRGWQNGSTGIGCAIPPVVRPTYLQNGRPPVPGGLQWSWERPPS